MLSTIQLWLAQGRLAAIHRAQDLNERALARAAEGTERHQELRSEAMLLQSEAQEAQRQVFGLEVQTGRRSDPIAASAAERRRKLLELRAHELEAGALRQAENFEQQGDHRQARIWRGEALNAYQSAAQELGAI